MFTAVLTLLLAENAKAQPIPSTGDVFELASQTRTASKASNGNTGNSRSGSMLVERVIQVSDVGVEVEYDLPPAATTQDRERQWQFPARVLKLQHGGARLLNEEELVARSKAWLAKGGFTPEDCGKSYFTWNVFRIECDPQSVLRAVERTDLGLGNLREADSYQDVDALGPAKLMQAKVGARSLHVTLTLNPEVVRRRKAEADVAVAQLMRKPNTLDAALEARSTDKISGSINITFDLDPAGWATRRTKVTTVTTTTANGVVETETISETLERRLVSQRRR